MPKMVYAIMEGARIIGHVKACSKKSAEKKAYELIAKEVIRKKNIRCVMVNKDWIRSQMPK